MNSKSEFHQARIVRVTVDAGLEREQGEEEGARMRVSWRGPRRARGREAGRWRRGTRPGAWDYTFTFFLTMQLVPTTSVIVQLLLDNGRSMTKTYCNKH